MGLPDDEVGLSAQPMTAAGAAAQLKREAETLKEFKKRVDGILRRLDSSPASKSQLSRETLQQASFGSADFAEAADLYRMYNRVHTHLTTLSQTFGDQIEAMKIAVHGADVGFDNLEEDVRQRFWDIHQRTKDRYEASRPAEERETDRNDDPGL